MIAHITKTESNHIKEQTVLEHLKGTAHVARILGEPLGISSLTYISALFHDLGKWRIAFKHYIYTVQDGNKANKINHSSAGAIFIYRRYYKNDDYQKLTVQLIAYAILSHHGLNDCLSPDGIDVFNSRIDNSENLDFEEVVKNLYNSNISMTEIDTEFEKAIQEVKVLRQQFEANKLSPSFSLGLLARMLLSILIDADRIDTAIFCGKRETKSTLQDFTLPWHQLCNNLEDSLKQFNSISNLREKISLECKAFAKNPSAIYRLSVPTGGAKP
ncbi:CRISPR-associated endonuclease Cas3'' [Dielma fastidiosa]|uniref:CRISPR-associated endonuclease Cas3-HD n=1 Tax=Dielma fastidiosa TaxID=1034346 RepID=A0A318KL48_9FIRM|nr:CRISPR-associated endonuclease Cas3'' [Dielma fastidiosa]PXX77122.1 CRISPR-associated endonuclease Cas3-HD [Dielma fastidiosa]